MKIKDWHIEYETEGCYQYNVKDAKEKKKYIKASISKECIGHLLQGKHIALLFLDGGCELEGMIDIELSNGKTTFEVSEELNEIIINT